MAYLAGGAQTPGRPLMRGAGKYTAQEAGSFPAAGAGEGSAPSLRRFLFLRLPPLSRPPRFEGILSLGNGTGKAGAPRAGGRKGGTRA